MPEIVGQTLKFSDKMAIVLDREYWKAHNFWRGDYRSNFLITLRVHKNDKKSFSYRQQHGQLYMPGMRDIKDGGCVPIQTYRQTRQAEMQVPMRTQVPCFSRKKKTLQI